MNFYDIHWWKGHNRLENSNFFQYLNPQELTERFDEMPLSQELLRGFLDNHVKQIWQSRFIERDKEYGKLVPCAPWDSYNFIIYLNKNNSVPKKASTLIHECIHGIYRVVGRPDGTVHKMIDSEEERFFKENREFSIDSFKKYSKLRE